MKDLCNSIRQKRFSIKASCPASLVVGNDPSELIRFQLKNLSLTGVGAFRLLEDIETPLVELNEIYSTAKLQWEGGEYTLGRVVLKSRREAKSIHSGVEYGFSMIDSKLPLDTQLACLLEIPEGGAIKPYEFELSSEKFSLATFAEAQGPATDIFSKCHRFSLFYKDWQTHPKFQYGIVRTPSKGPRVDLDRPRPNGRKDYIVTGSYDYLGLSSHPRVLEAAKKAIDDYGFSATGSPVLTGTTQVHAELAQYIAKTLNKEDAILFSSGYAANVGTLAGLTSEKDLIIADFLSHASVHDGLKLSRAQSRLFRHNDTQHLEKILSEERSKYEGVLIVTEGVFSMDGDVAPIAEITRIAKKYDARVFIDEAHSFGLMGPNSAGLSDREGVLPQTDLVMSSLSKVCGAGGGFVAGNKDVVDWLRYYGRSHTFSGAMLPAAAAAALESLKIIQSEPERVESLFRNIRHFVQGLRELGAPISENHPSPIVPLIIGDERKMGIINQQLMDAGVYAIPVVYPAVSKKQCRFRFSITNHLSTSDIDYVLFALQHALAKADVQFSTEATTQSRLHKQVKASILAALSGTDSKLESVKCG